MATMSIDDAFVRQILRCFGDGKRRSQEEAELKYDQMYPPWLLSPRHVRKKRNPEIGTVSARQAIRFLLQEGYITKEVYRQEGDLVVYSITQKALPLLLKKS